MENLGDDLRPAVDEVDPAVLDLQTCPVPLRTRLVEEHEVPAIVEVPGDFVARGPHVVRERRAGRVLAETGCVDHERPRPQARRLGVVVCSAWCVDTLDWHVAPELAAQLPDPLPSWRAA